MLSTILDFAGDRAVLQKERSAGMYRLSAYFLSKSLSELPVELAWPTYFITILYFMSGLERSADKFFAALVMHLLNCLSAQAIGLAVACAVFTVRRGMVAATAIMNIMVLISGFYVSTSTLPSFVSWWRYISPVRFSYEAAVTIELRGQVYRCAAMVSTHLRNSSICRAVHNRMFSFERSRA